MPKNRFSTKNSLISPIKTGDCNMSNNHAKTTKQRYSLVTMFREKVTIQRNKPVDCDSKCPRLGWWCERSRAALVDLLIRPGQVVYQKPFGWSFLFINYLFLFSPSASCCFDAMVTISGSRQASDYLLFMSVSFYQHHQHEHQRPNEGFAMAVATTTSSSSSEQFSEGANQQPHAMLPQPHLLLPPLPPSNGHANATTKGSMTKALKQDNHHQHQQQVQCGLCGWNFDDDGFLNLHKGS